MTEPIMKTTTNVIIAATVHSNKPSMVRGLSNPARLGIWNKGFRNRILNTVINVPLTTSPAFAMLLTIVTKTQKPFGLVL